MRQLWRLPRAVQLHIAMWLDLGDSHDAAWFDEFWGAKARWLLVHNFRVRVRVYVHGPDLIYQIPPASAPLVWYAMTTIGPAHAPVLHSVRDRPAFVTEVDRGRPAIVASDNAKWDPQWEEAKYDEVGSIESADADFADAQGVGPAWAISHDEWAGRARTTIRCARSGPGSAC